ncbi:MAG: DNA topoisomerase [Spirochaetaceae bacterium]|jgi:DNA topoisomerase-3|nr:DNA topoisomerase [Spirochaetaceae bacterium]
MLVLCEKPSVAKEFAGALGCAGKKGFYEGGGNVVTYCVGHLFELINPDGYDPKLKSWRIEDLPIIPEKFVYEVKKDVSEQAACVTNLLTSHAEDDVLIATDAGREGELIARLALQEAGVSPTSRFRRFWVSEALTPDVIRSGIEAAKPLSEYDGLSAQGFARQKADWLVGMNLSRLMSVGNPPPAFSVGRVQTAVLAAIAARNNEVKNFVTVPYKALEALVSDKNGSRIKALLQNPDTQKPAFFEHDYPYLNEALAHCAGGLNIIDSVGVTQNQKRDKPPKLLNITGLQKEAYKKYGYTPEETLNIAQALYETHKCLSYPRTPSRVMGDNNVELFLEKFNLLKDFSPLSALCDTSLISQDNKHIFNSKALEDHHALIPLAPLPEAANEKERNVYEIVLRSFFIVCMPDFLYNEKALVFHIGKYIFNAKIREVLESGWKKAGGENKEGSDEQEVERFDESECSLVQTSVLEKSTEPKKEFSLDTLLSFMERPKDGGDEKLAGLGTPATRAEIIKTLFTKQYIIESKKKLYASERARFLLDQLAKDDDLRKIADVSTTTDWEQRLAENPADFEKDIVSFIKSCIKKDIKRDSFFDSMGKCPVCGKPVAESKISFSCTGWKDSPKCGFSIWKEVCGAKITADDAKLLLLGQKTPVKKCTSKKGEPFETAFFLQGAELKFSFPERSQIKKGK